MAEMDPAGLVKPANPFPITRAELIPVQRYFEAEFFQAEADHLWPHAWQMACRLEQIPQVGDWIEYANLGKSVIVVRTKQGVKAFHNHCRHRGVPIAGGHGIENGASDHGNCAKAGFICPFHGWRWNLEGECTFVYGRQFFSDDLLEKDELALRPVRVEQALGCAFINLDDHAPGLRESFGPVVDRLEAHGAHKLRSEWWFGAVLPANWKIAMEAFMEGYHVMKTHPQLQHAAPALYNGRYGHETGGVGVPINPNSSWRDNIDAQLEHFELLSSGMAGMCHAKEVEIARQFAHVELEGEPGPALQAWFAQVQDAVVKQLRARGEDVPDLNAIAVTDPVNAVEFLFPHYFLLPFFTSMASYRIRPLGPESCLFEIWSLTNFPAGQEPAPPMKPTILPYDSPEFPTIPRQDYSNIPIQQKGLHSQGFDHMRLGKGVEGLISNYQRLIDGYIDGADPARLAQATQLLGGNFDGPVLDLGL